METLKFNRASFIFKFSGFNLIELTVAMLFTVLIITKLIRIADNNTTKVQQNYLNWCEKNIQKNNVTDSFEQ